MRASNHGENLVHYFLDSDKIVNPVDLDFSDLKKYPELPYIAIRK